MLKIEGIRRRRAEKILILYHGEQKTLGDWPQDEVIYRQGFWSGSECEYLEIDSRQNISRYASSD